MEKIIEYLNSLSTDEQLKFAEKCGTSVGYLRKAVSKKQQLGESICINIERESNRFVLCEDIRPDVDWAYIRETKKAA